VVPHANDSAITFPNLDSKLQSTKLITTTVLYVDMRRSTQLSLQHRKPVVARLYSAFVRAMTRSARYFGGQVRGIIGDRVMVLFNESGCFTSAVDTAFLMNSVGKFVINKYFTHNEVSLGIGLDHGTILATKTGLRSKGQDQHNYRSLVWLGRPANIASKLTDAANKPAETNVLTIMKVLYRTANGGLVSRNEWPHEFVKKFYHSALNGNMLCSESGFHSFTTEDQMFTVKEATPPILMTEAVYKGFKSARPSDNAVVQGWIKEHQVSVPGFSGSVFGCDVHFNAFSAA
jgi:adenylate cyclase